VDGLQRLARCDKGLVVDVSVAACVEEIFERFERVHGGKVGHEGGKGVRRRRFIMEELI
jgi:hypothetical protein